MPWMACLDLSKLWKFNILTVCWRAPYKTLSESMCVCVCDSPFGIVYRASASRKVWESLLSDTHYKMVTQEEDGVQQAIFTGLQNVWCQRLHPFQALAWESDTSPAPPDMCDIMSHSVEMSHGYAGDSSSQQLPNWPNRNINTVHFDHWWLV